MLLGPMEQLRRASARTLDWVIALHVPGTGTRDGCLAYSLSPGLAADMLGRANREPGTAVRVLHSVLEAVEPDPVMRLSTHMVPLLLSDRLRLGEEGMKACVDAVRRLAPRVDYKRRSDHPLIDFGKVDSCAKVIRGTPVRARPLRDVDPPALPSDRPCPPLRELLKPFAVR
jgi:hypothetical protein